MDETFSDAEKEAKRVIFNILLKGSQQTELCDSSFLEENFKIPDFYDDIKFKRGQKYFADNRFGIIQSHMGGLFSLICEPAGAAALDKTNHSSNARLARKRYTQTGYHVTSWCSSELKPGSQSWESLKAVRKMHLAASNAALSRKELGLPQGAMAFTTFGFMGYALVKPHFLGINSKCIEDRKAYVHMWAVICSMLGIKDEFNICLHSLEVVEIICHILLRYHFNPLMQMDTKIFQKLGRAFADGMGIFMPFFTYDSMLFLSRRLAGVPGYQYKVDRSKEYYLRQIFTKSELETLKLMFQNVPGFEYRRALIFDEKWHLINVKKAEDTNDKVSSCEKYKHLLKLYDLDPVYQLEVVEIEEEDFESYLNDDQFLKLNILDQLTIWLVVQLENVENSWIKFFLEFTSLSIMSVLTFIETRAKYIYKTKQ